MLLYLIVIGSPVTSIQPVLTISKGSVPFLDETRSKIVVPGVCSTGV